MVCVVYCVGKWQGWGQFNSELELQLNSNSKIGIGIEIDGIENSGIGIENRNWIFATATTAFTSQQTIFKF